jgi:hypothetical protein
MKSYSPQNIIILVNGVEIVNFADGDDAISVKKMTDSASHKMGLQGNMEVSISADFSGEVAFKLQKTSPSNAYLKSLLDQQSSLGGVAFVPVFVTALDVLRQDMGIGSFGYIKKPAEQQFGEHATNQAWDIVVENLEQVYGDL